MAYADFTPEFRVQEAQDATAFRLWDSSIWNGESGITTICVVRLFYYDVDGTITAYDDYELITGADTTKFDEYISIDGHTVEITDLTIGGDPAEERFVDGYYVVRIIYSDGTYVVGSEPYFDNTQAFLAKARCKARKLPVKLTWPLTGNMYEINRDIFMQSMYLGAAEDSVDLGKENEFRKFMDLINNIFDYYAISECF